MAPSWWPRHFLSATSFALLLGFGFGGAFELSTSNHNRPVGIDRGVDRFSDHDDFPMPTAFKKDFTRPLDIPEEGLQTAMEVLRSGRLFRYSTEAAELSQVALAEADFAQAMGARYAVGVNSCSSAILIGLMCVGVKAGDEVLTNAFTFTAVPSTILRLGAKPCLVECGDNWTMDLDDLEKKASGGHAKVLLLSHMRGKVCDMDRVSEICERHRLMLVEDCAHAAGVTWRGRQLGYHAKVSAFSTQSDKVINSGEGGFVTTSDDEMAAKAIYLSGAYEGRYSKHLVRPSDALCEAARFSEPNLSVRMSETTAAVLRPLLKSLPSRVLEYNRIYNIVVKTMEAEAPGLIDVPEQHELVGAVGDHLNFRLKKASDEGNLSFQAKCKELGVPVNWLRSSGNARWHVNWRGFGSPAQDLPVTDSALAMAYDLKLPPYFEDEDFVHLARIIAYAARVCCRSAADGGGSPRVSPQHQQEEGSPSAGSDSHAISSLMSRAKFVLRNAGEIRLPLAARHVLLSRGGMP